MIQRLNLSTIKQKQKTDRVGIDQTSDGPNQMKIIRQYINRGVQSN